MATYDNRSRAFLARDEILKLIEKGNYTPGDQLPSERKLAEQFSISRPTVREALSILEEEGLIYRKVGVGTFVSQRPIIDAGLETLSSFTEMMSAAGFTAGTSLLHVIEAAATPEDAALFGVADGEPLLVVERVRTLDDQPIMFSIHTVPKALIGDVPEHRFRGSLFGLIEERSGIRMSHAHTSIYSSLAGKEVAAKLGCNPESPLLVLDERNYSTENRLMFTGLSLFRAELHRYHIVRRRPTDTGL